MRATGRGRSAGGGAPSPRKTIAHGRLSGWMRESSNNTVGGMRYPRCVSATRSGEVKKDGINITRLSKDKVIIQGYLKGGFFSLREVGCDIFPNGR